MFGNGRIEQLSTQTRARKPEFRIDQNAQGAAIIPSPRFFWGNRSSKGNTERMGVNSLLLMARLRIICVRFGYLDRFRQSFS
ncbi:hypothetical protein CDL15_Pgr012720 [Punica granatum]|uniref:Uncharacterized protein n=1 Tax=Punica granatum TaxID=22663 RepID=A0A218XEX7_PUNGR|nr:hypothetical protein CDL15_Pgr012720 [Punica granatum]